MAPISYPVRYWLVSVCEPLIWAYDPGAYRNTHRLTDEMNTDIDRRDFSDMQSVLLHARSPVRKCILICR